MVAVGFGGKAGIEEARTDKLKAPVVVGVPVKGPCEVGPVTCGLTTGGGGGLETADAGMETYDAVGAGAAITAGAMSTTAFKKTYETIFSRCLCWKVRERGAEVVD